MCLLVATSSYHGHDWKNRQDCLAPDSSVKQLSKSFIMGNRKFRKFEFVDGSTTVAPKGYLFSGSADNGDNKQGLITVFKPMPDNENGGFIMNANYIDWPLST